LRRISEMRYLNNLIIVAILSGCSLTSKAIPIPTAAQIATNPVYQQLARHRNKAAILSSIVAQVELYAETTKRLLVLDEARYHYIRKIEVLIASGDFNEAKRYLDAADITLSSMMEVLRNEAIEPSENSKEEQPEKGIPDRKTFL